MTLLQLSQSAAAVQRLCNRDYGGRALFTRVIIALATVLPLIPMSLNAQDQPSLAVAPMLADAAERVVIPARPLNLDAVKRTIGYPSEAAAKALTGTVVAQMLVDEQGQVTRYVVTGKCDPILKEAVAAHLMDLKFEPGTRGTKPIDMWVVVKFNFTSF